MIIKAPDPKLTRLCSDCPPAEVKTISKQLLTEYQEAFAAEKKHHNLVVGLAAPQIGINRRAFTAFGHVFINPKIMWESPDEIDSREGCLSLDRKEQTDRKRHRSVNLYWLDKSRTAHRQYFNDDAAVIIQHEMDHLKGVMCND